MKKKKKERKKKKKKKKKRERKKAEGEKALIPHRRERKSALGFFGSEPILQNFKEYPVRRYTSFSARPLNTRAHLGQHHRPRQPRPYATITFSFRSAHRLGILRQ
jgi:sRNA-binding protein